MVTNLGIRRLAAQDIPEMRKLFRATVLTVNSKDYTKEEVEDWASCGDSVEHWKELLAKNDYIGALDGQGGIVGFSSMNVCPQGLARKRCGNLVAFGSGKDGSWIWGTQNKC